MQDLFVKICQPSLGSQLASKVIYLKLQLVLAAFFALLLVSVPVAILKVYQRQQYRWSQI
jgi:hypothetical protein